MKLLISICILLVPAGQAERYRDRIPSRAEFDSLSRTWREGRLNAVPHVMFIIDRLDGNRVYYINSNRYSFHREFANANYLTLERGEEFFRRNYLEPGRRFILGTVARQPLTEKFTFEFWEGDRATPEIIETAFRRLNETFFTRIIFKPNSGQQEEAYSRTTGVEAAASRDGSADYLPFNLAEGVGVLRIIDRMTEETIIDRNEIVIFREPPLTVTPLSGIITTTGSTPLAHVNLLARGWGIPNAFIRDADRLFAPLEGKFVFFRTGEDGYVMRPAENDETAEFGRRLAERSDLLTPAADLEFREMTELARQRRTDSLRFGAKSANLGEVISAVRRGEVTGISVPAGFTIPFHHYISFIESNGIDREILEMLSNDRFNHDAAYRKRRLSELRARIVNARLDPSFARSVIRRKRAMLGVKGVFVRSSTNSEDLPYFSGAGLYTSVPNVRDDKALTDAVKTVWASLWNYEAYEARESFGINHAAVYPAVLIQEGIDADSAGVLITTNPFDREDAEGVYINAKRGLGIRVVEGRRVPEQIIYHPVTGAIRVLTRSADDIMLRFDSRGGVREVATGTDRRVLTDDIVRRLSRAAIEIEKLFDGKDQDIEWLTVGGKIHIVQSRPFIDSSRTYAERLQ